MSNIFLDVNFNGNISNWDVKNVTTMSNFDNIKINNSNSFNKYKKTLSR